MYESLEKSVSNIFLEVDGTELKFKYWNKYVIVYDLILHPSKFFQF